MSEARRGGPDIDLNEIAGELGGGDMVGRGSPTTAQSPATSAGGGLPTAVGGGSPTGSGALARPTASGQAPAHNASAGVTTPWSLFSFSTSNLSKEDGGGRYPSGTPFIPDTPTELHILLGRLGEDALQIACEIRRRMRMKGSSTVPLPMTCLGAFGRDRHYAKRGLKKLVAAGVVSVSREPGAKSPLVTALVRPWKFEQPAELPDHKHDFVLTPAGPAERIGACPRCAFENGDRVVVRRGKKHPVTVKPGMTLTFGPAPSTPEISLAGEKGVETMSWNEIKARAGEAPALRPTKPADNIIDLSGL